MAKRQTIVINNTGQVGDFYDKRLQPGQSWSIPDVTINAWREDLTLSGSLQSGALLVSDGTQILSSGTKALDYFYERLDISLEVNNFLTSSGGGDAVAEAFVASASGVETLQQALQETPPAGQAGSVIQMSFVHEGSSSTNRWLCTGGDTGITSDRSPAVAPFDCKIIAMTYSNRDNNADVDLEIYSVLEANTNQKDVEFVWELRDCRTARKSNFDPEITLNAGDRVAVYARDKGVNPDYCVLTLYLQITANTSEEVVRMFSGNFSVGGTPESDD